MSRTTQYLSLTAILATMVLCAPRSVPAFENTGPGYGPGCREPGIFGCIASLDLTETQKNELDALRTDTRNKILPLREELQRLEIPEALFAKTIDTAALEDLLSRKKSINAEIIEIRHEAMVSAVLLLTPEQRSLMLERKKSRPFFRGQGRRGAGMRANCPW
jgi:Spy/CpxP family protein refolding chaperone